MEEDREDEGGDKDAEGDYEGADQPAGQVADEGGEDDQRRRQDAANGETFHELIVGQPVVAFDGAAVQERDNGVGTAEGKQAAFKPSKRIGGNPQQSVGFEPLVAQMERDAGGSAADS